jgi:hypothetical protein
MLSHQLLLLTLLLAVAAVQLVAAVRSFRSVEYIWRIIASVLWQMRLCVHALAGRLHTVDATYCCLLMSGLPLGYQRS